MGMVIAILFVVIWVAIFVRNARHAKKMKLNFEYNSQQTQYNPATGLPMIGAFDSMGNTMGSSSYSSSSSSSDSFHNSTSFSSSYDPFTNRFS
ncbi:TPA: hypothetical protein KKX77_002642 [Legionella pneumophila]|nr:hypothetical protein [Legionella pneumophila]HCU5995171.1 hypothetical protein [Legionella pneumophila]